MRVSSKNIFLLLFFFPIINVMSNDQVIPSLQNNGVNENYIGSYPHLTVHFKWKISSQVGGKHTYFLNIFNKKKELIKKIKTTKFSHYQDLKEEGKYLWQVTTPNKSIKNSPLFFLNLNSPPAISSTPPEAPTLNLEFDQNKQCYLLILPKKESAKSYSLKVIHRKEEILLIKKSSISNVFCIKINIADSSNYYYRYYVIDKWNRESKVSKKGHIKYVNNDF